MSSVKLVHLPDTQLLRLQAMRNTCVRMDSLVVTYFDQEEMDVASANMARFDINEALKKLMPSKKFSFGSEKFSVNPKNIRRKKMGREQILEILDDLKEQLDSKKPTVSMVAEVIPALSKYDILSLDEALHIASNLAQIHIALDKIKNIINEIEIIIKNSGQPEKK